MAKHCKSHPSKLQSLYPNHAKSVSPTVYVAYNSLRAFANCRNFGREFRRGGVYQTTIGYPPDALSTSGGLRDGRQAVRRTFSPIDYESFQFSPGPFSPILSLPRDLSTVDPAWSSCTPVPYGSLDPPRVLEGAPALVDPQDGANKPPAPGPGAGVKPPNPEPTTGPGSAPEPLKDDPPESGPPKADAPPNSDPPDSGSPPQNDPPKDNLPNNDPPKQADHPQQPNPPQQADSIQQANSLQSDSPPTAAGSGREDFPEVNDNNPTNNLSSPQDGPGDAPAVPNPLPSPLADKTVQQADGGGAVIDGTTFTPGAQPTIDGTPISVGSGRLVVGGSTIAVPPSGITPVKDNPVVMVTPPSVFIGDNPVSKDANGDVVIGGSTYAPGSQATIDGTPVSIGKDNIEIDGTSHAVPADQNSRPVLVGDQKITKASSGGVIIAGATYTPGATGQVSGTPISIGSDNVVVGGAAYSLPTSGAPGPPLIAGQAITKASNGGIIVAGSTIPPGSQATISGQAVSVGPAFAVIDGLTYALPTTAGGVLQQGSTGPVTAITLPNGEIITAGGPSATQLGHVVAIPTDGSGLVVDGKTISLPSTPGSIFAVAGQTFTAAPTGFVLAGQTLSPGGSAITLSGTVVSLGPSGLQIGSSTIPLATGTGTGAGGDLVLSGLAGSPTSSPNDAVSFTGGSCKSSSMDLLLLRISLALIAALGCGVFML